MQQDSGAGDNFVPSAAADVLAVPSAMDHSTHLSLLTQRLRQSWAQVGLQLGKDERLDLEKLLNRVPIDENGRRLSVGSIPHGSGTCRPCTFAASGTGCHVGVFCRFCHSQHPGVRRTKARPCKGKRDRYRNLLDKLSAQAEADPEKFSICEDKLPPSIRCDAKKKSKLIEAVAQSVEKTSRQHSASEKQTLLGKGQESPQAARSPAPLSAPFEMPFEAPFSTQLEKSILEQLTSTGLRL